MLDNINERNMAGSRSCSVLYTAFDVQIFSDEVSTKTYVDLFLDLSGNLREVPLQARSNYVKFDSIKPLNEDKLEHGFRCEIFKSTGLTSNFRDTVESQNVKLDTNRYIPTNYKANPKDFSAVFYPSERKIICELSFKKNKTAHAIVEEFLKKLVNTPTLNNKFKRIEITPIYEKITADDINHNKTLTYVEAVINNIPDSFDDPNIVLSDKDRIFLKSLADSNLESYSQVLKSKKAKFLELTDLNKDFIRLAIEYGFVKFHYKNIDSLTEKKNTLNISPFTKRLKIFPEEVYGDFLIRETRKIAEHLA